MLQPHASTCFPSPRSLHFGPPPELPLSSHYRSIHYLIDACACSSPLITGFLSFVYSIFPAKCTHRLVHCTWTISFCPRRAVGSHTLRPFGPSPIRTTPRDWRDAPADLPHTSPVGRCETLQAPPGGYPTPLQVFHTRRCHSPKSTTSRS